MRQTIRFELVTKSENHYRGGNRFAHAAFTKAQRATVALALLRLQRRPLALADRANTFEVTMTRISFRQLDDDNIRGSLKAVRDEIAKWIGLDDRDRRIVWRYLQQPCARGFQGVQITITDEDDPHAEIDQAFGTSPIFHGPASERGDRSGEGRRGMARVHPKGKPAGCARGGAACASRARRGRDRDPSLLAGAPSEARTGGRGGESRELPFRRAYAALPWAQTGGGLDLTELGELAGSSDPPVRIAVRPPIPIHRGGACFSAAPVVLHRNLHRDAEHGEIWIYLTEDQGDENP